MEAYPQEYVEHNLPLVILSGLGDKPGPHEKAASPGSGTKISVASPECSGDRAESLLHQLQQFDGSNFAWNSSSLPGSTGNIRYRIRAIGRSYVLPPRKAAPLPQSPSTEGVPSGSPTRTQLHSPLSPLSPSSPVFPDGIMTPVWLARHQRHVPALFVAFFRMDASGTAESDEEIKADINAVRQALSRSGFKPRFAAVLLSDKSILNAPQIEERLTSIRRSTSLDAKTGLFFMPPMSSQGEIATFAHSIMSTLQPSILEYYRDLTKHARRKKTKGGGSPPSIPPGFDIKPLTSAGWSIRYEVKQGVFAEFRQEMDVAERHFSTAIDEMFATDGVFEVCESSSPRWGEARLLCDCLAIRILRCHLWTSQTTAAVQFWMNYRSRMKGLIGRKGKGLQTYSWDAWESRWAEIMAQLVQRADLEALRLPSSKDENESPGETKLQLYAAPEKAFTTVERLAPFQSLHHTGYWLRLAAQRFKSRLERALAIPTDDREPPDQSPASRIATRSASYDLYLVPEPYAEFSLASFDKVPAESVQSYETLVDLSQKSIEQFVRRGQTRFGDFVTLELAHDLIHGARFDEGLQILRPLWEASTWRGEEWHDIFVDLLLAIRQCAQHMNDHDIVLATTYELMSVATPLAAGTTTKISEIMNDVQFDGRTALSFRDRQRLCPVSLAFAFKDSKTHVGDSLRCQLILTSRAREASDTLDLSAVNIYVGTTKTLVFNHSEADNTDISGLVDLGDLIESDDGALSATTSLSFDPGQQRILSFRLTLREAALLRVSEATILLTGDRFSIEHVFTEETLQPSDVFYVTTENGSLNRVVAAHADTTIVEVLPKPPKVKLTVVGHKSEYYAGENIRLMVQLKNHEIETVEGSIFAILPAESEDSIPMAWMGEGNSNVDDETLKDPRNGQVHAKTPKISTKHSHQLVLYAKAGTHPAKMDVSIDLKYSLASDQATILSKSLTISINVALPFDGKYNFGPLLCTDPWPSYFDPGFEPSDKSRGIPQLWRLGCQVQSLVSQSIFVHDVKSLIDHVAGDSSASSTGASVDEKHFYKPGQSQSFEFVLGTQKDSLDDRRPTAVESSLAITWSRNRDDEQVITCLTIPRLTLPVSEPRVLCTVSRPKTNDECDAILQYHIENPSTHFLTFAVSMEATEEFAFQGAKLRTLSLAPLSRYKVEYSIMLQDQDDEQATSKEGGRWISPMVSVTDSYYQKTLRVHPGGAGVRSDSTQDISVFVPTA